MVIKLFYKINAIGLLLFLSLFTLVLADDVVINKIIKLPNYSFKYSVKTTAQQETIWLRWADVAHWKQFDTLLEYSYLKEPKVFTKGAIGYVKASAAPKTKFKIIDYKQGMYFTEKLYLPLYHSLDLQRYFEKSETGETIFTHQVSFKGPLKSVLYLFLNQPFKKELPLVMGRLRDVAEKQEADKLK